MAAGDTSLHADAVRNYQRAVAALPNPRWGHTQ